MSYNSASILNTQLDSIYISYHKIMVDLMPIIFVCFNWNACFIFSWYSINFLCGLCFIYSFRKMGNIFIIPLPKKPSFLWRKKPTAYYNCIRTIFFTVYYYWFITVGFSSFFVTLSLWQLTISISNISVLIWKPRMQ